MRQYEALFIIEPEFDGEEIKNIIDRFTGVIEQQGGRVTKLEEWGKRRLAYEIKKFREGYYVLLHFEGDPAVAHELDRVFRISDSVMRHLITRLDGAS